MRAVSSTDGDIKVEEGSNTHNSCSLNVQYTSCWGRVFDMYRTLCPPPMDNVSLTHISFSGRGAVLTGVGSVTYSINAVILYLIAVYLS